MKSRLQQYRELALICAANDYNSSGSVRRHNRAATRMREIAAERGASEELLPLLTDRVAGKWLAFQLLEFGGISDEDSKRCLEVVEAIASGDSIDALGAQMWLKTYLEGKTAKS